MTEPNVGSGGNVVATLRMLVPQAAMAAYEKARLAAFPVDAAGQDWAGDNGSLDRAAALAVEPGQLRPFIGLLADKILFSPWERFFYRRWGTEKS